MTLICDTGVVYAAAVRGDARHAACAALLEGEEEIVLASPVVVEVDWLSRSRDVADVSHALLRSIAEGSVAVVELETADYSRVCELVEQYEDLPLDVVDASVVAVAERLGESRIATLDRRHFSVVRPRHVRSLRLLP